MNSSKDFFKFIGDQLAIEQVSMHEALKRFAAQNPAHPLRPSALAMADLVWKGQSVIPAMHPTLFSAHEIDFVRQGELNGQIVENLISLGKLG